MKFEYCVKSSCNNLFWLNYTLYMYKIIVLCLLFIPGPVLLGGVCWTTLVPPYNTCNLPSFSMSRIWWPSKFSRASWNKQCTFSFSHWEMNTEINLFISQKAYTVSDIQENLICTMTETSTNLSSDDSNSKNNQINKSGHKII